MGTASQFPFGEALIFERIGEAEMGGSPLFSPQHTFAPWAAKVRRWFLRTVAPTGLFSEARLSAERLAIIK